MGFLKTILQIMVKIDKPIRIVHRKGGKAPKQAYILHSPAVGKKFVASQSVKLSPDYLANVQALAKAIEEDEVSTIKGARDFLHSLVK